MKSFLYTTLLLILSLLTITACGSQANLVREEVNSSCYDLTPPPKSIGNKSDLIQYKGLSYILTERYAWSQSHIITLSGCIQALSCSQKWSDYRNECNKQRSFVREFILGRSKCDLPEPNC